MGSTSSPLSKNEVGSVEHWYQFMTYLSEDPNGTVKILEGSEDFYHEQEGIYKDIGGCVLMGIKLVELPEGFKSTE